jgi:hypothetical protein
MKISLLFPFLIFPMFLFAQGYQFVGSRSVALGNASVALEDVWSFHHNPAGLAGIKKVGAGVSYENRFMMRELQSQAFVVAYPMKKGVMSMGGQTFGFNAFRTYRTGLGYSLQLSDLFSMGVQLNHHFVRINPAYGNHQTVTGEVGALAKISPIWTIGFSIVNLSRNKISEFMEDRYTTLLRIGTTYKMSPVLMLLAEAEKDVEHPIRYKTGIEYLPMENFYIRGGFATQPIEYSFGVGYAFNGVYRLDVGSAFRQIIGWSPNFSFTVQMK